MLQKLVNRENFGGGDNNIIEDIVPHINLKDTIAKKELVDGCLFCLSYHPQKNILATARANSVHVWDLDNNSIQYDLDNCHNEVVTTLEWLDTPNNLMYTSSLDKTIKLWNNKQCIQNLTDHHDWIRSLAVSNSNNRLLSGCVSAGIYGWDVQTGVSLFKINNAHKHLDYTELNTINSLAFAHNSDNIFMSGARDGTIKIWDCRVGVKEVSHFHAHEKKINIALFRSNNNEILSAGRDNSLKLWDARMLDNVFSPIIRNKCNISPKIIQKYDKHKCGGYNVSTQFYSSEKYIITGSEDRSAYIYETSTGKVVRKLEGHSNVVHLLASKNDDSIITSSIDKCIFYVWSPDLSPNAKTKITVKDKEDTQSHEKIEKLLQKHGDEILRIFHKYNITLSRNWTSLRSTVDEEEVRDVLAKITRDLESSFEQN